MARSDYQFEVCANGVESCMAAQEGGADRVELCAGIPEGGTTPSYGEMMVARKVLKTTRLHVIIRPRGGDFVYTNLEQERMISDIDIARRLGADGVVFGCLTPEGEVDMAANSRLLQHCEGMSVTFHRAFDQCRHPKAALEQLIQLGFHRILTSGQQPTAADGTALLHELHEQAAGRIILLAGCGVNEGNIKLIQQASGVREFHFSARESFPGHAVYLNPSVYMGTEGMPENTLLQTTSRRVKATIEALCGNT